MKYLFLLIALACLISLASTQDPTLCEKYADALSLSEEELVGALVGGTFATALDNELLVTYFNGVQPPGSTNFLENSNATIVLATDLVEFFGEALGCGTLDPYEGRDMATIHEDMGVTGEAFELFNGALMSTFLFFATGTDLDIDEVYEDASAIFALLQSLEPTVCFGAGCGVQPYVYYAGTYFVDPNSGNPVSENYFVPPGGYVTFEEGDEVYFVTASGVHSVVQGEEAGGCTALEGGFSYTTDEVNDGVTHIVECPDDADGEMSQYFYCGVGTHCTNGMWGGWNVNCEADEESTSSSEDDDSSTSSSSANSLKSVFSYIF